MPLKQLTLSKLRKLSFINSTDNSQVNELNLVVTDDPKDKSSYEHIKFLYSGYTSIYKKKQLKKYSHTLKDYHDEEVVSSWLENKKNKKNKGDILYIQGLIKGDVFEGDKWNLSFLQVCDNNKIAWKCNSGIMVYEM